MVRRPFAYDASIGIDFVQLLESGVSYEQIAKRYLICGRTVRRYVRRLGLRAKLPPQKNRYRPPFKIKSPEKAYALWVKGRTLAGIGAQLGVTARTVSRSIQFLKGSQCRVKPLS